MKKKQSISQLLLLFFSVILGHSLVPHHHHPEILLASADHPCPFGQGEHHKTGEHPFHCHAFNELAFFKEDPTKLQVRTQSVVQHGLLHETTGLPIRSLHSESITLPLSIPVTSCSVKGQRSSRAPPHLS